MLYSLDLPFLLWAVFKLVILSVDRPAYILYHIGHFDIFTIFTPATFASNGTEMELRPKLRHNSVPR